jgi:hypothetical protein
MCRKEPKGERKEERRCHGVWAAGLACSDGSGWGHWRWRQPGLVRQVWALRRGALEKAGALHLTSCMDDFRTKSALSGTFYIS